MLPGHAKEERGVALILAQPTESIIILIQVVSQLKGLFLPQRHLEAAEAELRGRPRMVRCQWFRLLSSHEHLLTGDHG
ncbi:hypothetical protein DPEC_G00126470 [Dallia pectoralis]|uniref:Uncharacterized protein n=1 Tax=Dallia pectoralis TaxID=75939 RepID=A0ACC2GRS5_DALPE|nr:hypothetical protein DPEC_G00126470 [Dallia pectoralis]